jgi:hypothetical protein
MKSEFKVQAYRNVEKFGKNCNAVLVKNKQTHADWDK